MSTPLTDEQLAEIKARADAAEAEVFGIAEGKRDWTMQIPAREDTDSDLVIGSALADVDALLAEVKRLRTQMAAVEKFCAARAEYITAINGCPPGNSVDYWRWQGHAEGRRHLSKELGLPVAWPTEYEQAEQVTP